jgi:hypothetical protein
MLQLTLDVPVKQEEEGAPATPKASIHVWSKVVREEVDGVAFEFMIVRDGDREKLADLIKIVSTQ